jgi:hypothetical protein
MDRNTMDVYLCDLDNYNPIDHAASYDGKFTLIYFQRNTGNLAVNFYATTKLVEPIDNVVPNQIYTIPDLTFKLSPYLKVAGATTQFQIGTNEGELYKIPVQNDYFTFSIWIMVRSKDVEADFRLYSAINYIAENDTDKWILFHNDQNSKYNLQPSFAQLQFSPYMGRRERLVDCGWVSNGVVASYEAYPIYNSFSTAKYRIFYNSNNTGGDSYNDGTNSTFIQPATVPPNLDVPAVPLNVTSMTLDSPRTLIGLNDIHFS